MLKKSQLVEIIKKILLTIAAKYEILGNNLHKHVEPV